MCPVLLIFLNLIRHDNLILKKKKTVKMIGQIHFIIAIIYKNQTTISTAFFPNKFSVIYTEWY